MSKIKDKIILFFLKKLGVVDEFILSKKISEEKLILSSAYSAHQVVGRMKREMILEIFEKMSREGFVVYEERENHNTCSRDLRMKIISVKL